MAAHEWAARGVYDPVAQTLFVAYKSDPSAAARCFEYLDVRASAWARMSGAQAGWRYFREAIQDRFLHFEVVKARFDSIYAQGTARCVLATGLAEGVE